MTTNDKQEVLFMMRLTGHFVSLIRDYSTHLDFIDSEMTAVEALDFFADSMDMAGGLDGAIN
jgi:hypothetical protein